jgi:O-antigen ligase
VLQALLYVQLVFVVNQVHFQRLTTGIPALAPVNVIFLLVLLALRSRTEVLADRRPILKRPLLWFYAALTVAFLMGALRGGQTFIDLATYYKNALFFPLFYFVYFKCRQDERNTRRLIICIFVVAAIAGVEAIREGLDYGFGRYAPNRRASGPFGIDWHNANRAGVFYAMFMPMFVALALFLKGQKLWRLAAVGGCAVLAGGTLFTYSRQAYFLILLSIAVLLVRKSIILAAVISIALVSLAGYLPDAVFQRVDETKQTSSTGEEVVDSSTASRWELWAGGMQMLKDNPIGVGLYQFPKNIGNYTKYKDFDAHNFYVLTLAECGPFGLITLLLLIAACFKLARFLRKNTPEDEPETKALTIGFTIATLCMALGAIYGSPTLEGAVMAPYWALCGLLERYIHLKKLNAGQVIVETRPLTLAERFPLAAHILPGRR